MVDPFDKIDKKKGRVMKMDLVRSIVMIARIPNRSPYLEPEI